MTEVQSSSSRKSSYKTRPSFDGSGAGASRKSWKPRKDGAPQRSERPRWSDRGDRNSTGPRPFHREGRPTAPHNREHRNEFQDKSIRKIPEGADRVDEIKACGINACRAIFTTRKTDLVRAYVTEETVTEFGDMLKFCAANKKAYHVVTAEDLNRISGSTHHEGVCVIAKARPTSWQSLQLKLGEQKTTPSLLLILEDVGNPHNVGAMVRSAAHFGISAVLAAGIETFKPSPSLLRTAEGGAEQVDIVAAPNLEALVVELRKLGFKILATASNGKEKLYAETAIPARTALIIGNESRGISPTARKLADTTLSIPGSGTIESLNVSAATAVLCSEFWRRHKA